MYNYFLYYFFPFVFAKCDLRYTQTKIESTFSPVLLLSNDDTSIRGDSVLEEAATCGNIIYFFMKREALNALDGKPTVRSLSLNEAR